MFVSPSSMFSNRVLHTVRSSAAADRDFDTLVDTASTDATSGATSGTGTGITTSTGGDIRAGTAGIRIDPRDVHRFAEPTREGVASLAVDLAEELDRVLGSAGLAAEPPITFTIDSTGIHASGDRDDLAAVESVVQGDSHLALSLRITKAIAEQAHALEQTDPDKSYRNETDPVRAIAKYQEMMAAHRTTPMALVWNGTAVSVAAGRQTWL